MITILVVDDEVDMEPLLRGRFRQQIQQKIYTFLFAQNGRQALTFIQDEPTIACCFWASKRGSSAIVLMLAGVLLSNNHSLSNRLAG